MNKKLEIIPTIVDGVQIGLKNFPSLVIASILYVLPCKQCLAVWLREKLFPQFLFLIQHTVRISALTSCYVVLCTFQY